MRPKGLYGSAERQDTAIDTLYKGLYATTGLGRHWCVGAS
jgi:hypothetical protein